MTIEESRGSFGGENGSNDRFPVGMRVLAVDDDPTCLMLLEGLLRKCQYRVTTTSQARTALRMLRENKDRFDLVISDVHMPDMDGFKLLELVGLEMDLPVIMLSANSDAKLVMKGITHGACDYLVKPVRIEELKNIWQHVIRRKTSDSKNHDKRDKVCHGNAEDERGDVLTSGVDQNGKLNRKRKDDEEEGEDNGYENEEPGTQKKPRVVWSIELHRKFVAAVNQMGIDKAVPKRILDLMNVEGLTRENVASHLQKYRLYLKRISSVATHQAHMVAALGGKDSSYMRIGSIDGFGDFRTQNGSGRIPSTAVSPYPPSGMLGRLNTPVGVSLSSLASSPLIQPSHAQNSGHSFSSLGKYQPIFSPANQHTSSLQGVHALSELDHSQQRKCNDHIGDFNPFGDPTILTAVSTFTDNSLPSISSNHILLGKHFQQTQGAGGFENQPSLGVASFNSEPFSIGVGASYSLDQVRGMDSWQNAIPLPNLRESFHHNQMPLNRARENAPSTASSIPNIPLDFSSTSSIPSTLEDSRGMIQGQGCLTGDIVQNMNQSSSQLWGGVGPLTQGLDQLHGVGSRSMGSSLILQSSNGPSTMVHHREVEKSSNEGYLSEQTRTHHGSVSRTYDSFDGLVNAMIKKDQEGTMLMDGEFGADTYSYGSCV